MQTFMPKPANRIAAASPMPEAPPVITATLLDEKAACGTAVLRQNGVTPTGVLQNVLGAIHETAWEVFVRRFVRPAGALYDTPSAL
jgi:hypothetical protein